LREASERGFTRLDLDADPEATPFYLHFGAVRLGSTPSGSIPVASSRTSSSGSAPGQPAAPPTD
jgi:hypothetical protein